MPTTPIPLTDLTSGAVAGNGVFDKLMAASRAHLEGEFLAGRIKAGEYATVYLGALEASMRNAMEFLALSRKLDLEAQVLEKQVENLAAQKLQVEAQTEQVEAQTTLLGHQSSQAQAQTAHVQAQTAQLTLQGELLEAQAAHVGAQTTHLGVQSEQVEAQTAHIVAQTAHLVLQGEQVEAQTILTQAQTTQAGKQAALLENQAAAVEAETALTTQRTANSVIEGTVLTAQKCKLDAEYDNLMLNKERTTQETALLVQKQATEKAQVTALGVDADSVVGRQKALYAAQTAGFARDAEQKAADIYVRAWGIRRTTDADNTPATTTNKLDDASLGSVLSKMMVGVGVGT